ncbi:hypothetical protein CAPTEDRAFT_195737 [Capitella teleta]|uniref:Endonuclease/exonuclease/phosphatase domain-containing protein n=1 Tax=Capitella teleta TaxID=283909 RepID=R7UNT6_CAPTE|nr:hypothetical protein CAPTEDRAFT_195737 [Capitella teleta]|eukprot:ELU05572.1 hypothetical protein CAPTEDRAFT_195737 [Capitella teleta]
MAMTELYWPGGYINTDFNRVSLHSLSLQRVINDESLCQTRLHSHEDFTFENSLGQRSSIDHFFVNDCLTDDEACCMILHETANFSDHAALSLTLTHLDAYDASRRLNASKCDGSETTQYYVQRNTPVWCMLLDASQVFILCSMRHSFEACSRRTCSLEVVSGAFVSRSMEGVYLGHLINFDSKLPPICCTEDLKRRTNILASRFGHCGLEVKYRLFEAHCMSADGSSL